MQKEKFSLAKENDKKINNNPFPSEIPIYSSFNNKVENVNSMDFQLEDFKEKNEKKFSKTGSVIIKQKKIKGNGNNNLINYTSDDPIEDTFKNINTKNKQILKIFDKMKSNEYEVLNTLPENSCNLFNENYPKRPNNIKDIQYFTYDNIKGVNLKIYDIDKKQSPDKILLRMDEDRDKLKINKHQVSFKDNNHDNKFNNINEIGEKVSSHRNYVQQMSNRTYNKNKEINNDNDNELSLISQGNFGILSDDFNSDIEEIKNVKAENNKKEKINLINENENEDNNNKKQNKIKSSFNYITKSEPIEFNFIQKSSLAEKYKNLQSSVKQINLEFKNLNTSPDKDIKLNNNIIENDSLNKEKEKNINITSENLTINYLLKEENSKEKTKNKKEENFVIKNENHLTFFSKENDINKNMKEMLFTFNERNLISQNKNNFEDISENLSIDNTINLNINSNYKSKSEEKSNISNSHLSYTQIKNRQKISNSKNEGKKKRSGNFNSVFTLKIYRKNFWEKNSENKNSKIIVYAGGENIIKFWDYETNKITKILKGHTDHIYCLKKINYDYLLSGSLDKTIRLWDINSEVCVKKFDWHHKAVSNLIKLNFITRKIVSNREPYKDFVICSSGWDGYLKFFDLENNELLNEIKVCYSTDNNANDKRGIDLFKNDASELECLFNENLNGVNFDEGKSLHNPVTSLRKIRLVNGRSIKYLIAVGGKKINIYKISLIKKIQNNKKDYKEKNENEENLNNENSDNRNSQINPYVKKLNHEIIKELEGHEGYINDLKFLNLDRGKELIDKIHILSVGNDKLIKLWNFNSGENTKTFRGHNDSIRCLMKIKYFSEKNSRIFASGSADEKIYIWNLETGDVIDILEGHKDGILCLQQIPNKESLTLVSGSGGHNEEPLKIWK